MADERHDNAQSARTAEPSRATPADVERLVATHLPWLLSALMSVPLSGLGKAKFLSVAVHPRDVSCHRFSDH